MDLKFALFFFLLVAVAAFITKRMMGHSGQPLTTEDIVSEIAPMFNDPPALHRKVARDLRHSRIAGVGTITDIRTSPKTVIFLTLRERITAAETDGAASVRDVVFELMFMRPDDPDDAGVNQYVEFTEFSSISRLREGDAGSDGGAGRNPLHRRRAARRCGRGRGAAGYRRGVPIEGYDCGVADA